MNPALSPLSLALVVLLGTPAFAGSAAFDLPRLSFPEPRPDIAGQACAAPAATTGTVCAPDKS